MTTALITALASFCGAIAGVLALLHVSAWKARRQQRTLERAAAEWFANVASQHKAKQEGRHVQ